MLSKEAQRYDDRVQTDRPQWHGCDAIGHYVCGQTENNAEVYLRIPMSSLGNSNELPSPY